MSESGENQFDKTMVLAPSALKEKQVVPKAKLVCLEPERLPGPEGREVVLESQAVTVGRGDENHVTLKVEGVSRMHARFFPSGDMWGVEDLGSTNGVRVNQAKAHEVWLKHGDVVELGSIKYQYLVEGKEPPKPKAAAKPDLDLTGAGDSTVLMGKPAQASASAGAKPVAAKPKATKPPPAETVRARPAPAKSDTAKGSNLGLWLIIVGALLLGGVIVVAML